MRMWMADPYGMCRKHLLGEHVELHMAAAWIRKGRCVDGWTDGNCLEPASLGPRHAALAREMVRRGYRHASPLVQPRIGGAQRLETRVDRGKALKELLRRCPGCRKRFKALKKKAKIAVSNARVPRIITLAG